jgi:hypothetical protein
MKFHTGLLRIFMQPRVSLNMSCLYRLCAQEYDKGFGFKEAILAYTPDTASE